MIDYYITDDRKVYERNEYEPNCWIKMTEPKIEESKMIAKLLNIDLSDIRAAVDREEKSRVEILDGYTLILIDVPTRETRNDTSTYTTVPMGIILMEKCLITVCVEDNRVLKPFTDGRIAGFSTKKRFRFIYQIMLQTATRYQRYLRLIDKRRIEIEEKVKQTTEDDLIELHELESTLVYFATSLRENGKVLDKLQRYERLERFPEDQELQGDVVVENQQAIEMTNIYRDIIDGTRELMSTILENRLNNVMKMLTSVTFILAIPTMISGLYGMNVDSQWVPLANVAHGFEIIVAIVLALCILLFLFFRKLKML